MKRTTQAEIRRIRDHEAAGTLADAVEMIETGARAEGDFLPLLYSMGAQGVNGKVIKDSQTGDLYADAKRTTEALYF